MGDTTSKPAAMNAEGKEALTALRPLIDAMSAEELAPVNLDRLAAAVTMLQVGQYVQHDAVKAEFAKLHADHFDQTHVERLPSVALALFYATERSADAEARRRPTRLDPELVQTGRSLRERMLRVVDYNLDDVDDVSLRTTHIRKGRGYLDLAADLLALYRIYVQYAATLAADKKHYQPSDADDAAKTAEAIQAQLDTGLTEEQRQAIFDARAVWTLAVESYSEVRTAAQFIYRHAPDRLTFFPSLYEGRGPSAPPAAPPTE